MNLRCLHVTILAGWLSLHAFVLAQSPSGRGMPDHPSHRYLSPPQGKGTLSEQIQSLENLSHSPEQQRPAQPALSPAQLKQLDAILESFRGENGELNVPAPDQVPKQWIDSLLPDPKQRQQAKEMLEEYSRNRNVPLNQGANTGSLPPIDSRESDLSAPQSNSNRSDSRRSEGNQRDPFGPSSSRSPNREFNQPESNTSSGRSEDTDRIGEQPPSSTDNAVRSDELPKDTPPALRNLYETLKQFQQQKEQQERESVNSRIGRRPAQANGDRAGGSPRNDPRANRPVKPFEPARNAGRPPSSNGKQSVNPLNNLPPSRLRSQPQVADNDSANGSGSTGIAREDNSTAKNTNNHVDPNDSNDGSLLKAGVGDTSSNEIAESSSKSTEPQTPKLTPFDEGFDFSADRKLAVDPFAEALNRSADPGAKGGAGTKQFTPPPRPTEPFNVRRMSQQPQSPPVSADPRATNSSSASENFDWKKSVNDLGLAPALKRIVQKTLKEQGFDPSQTGNSAMPNRTGSRGNSNASTDSDFSFNGLPSPQQAEQIKKWANSVATAPNGTANGTANRSTSGSNSQWGKWMGEVWKAMAEAPVRSDRGLSTSSSTAAVSAATGSGSFPDFRWTNSMSLALLVTAALILLLVWFSRRRVAELADASAAQAEWVRTVIAQGLKSRADVVRAFHQLVKQSRAVSDWWTHRSIVNHFNKQSPQLASAISELAVVYEQARYYPEEAELSPQQLAQVRALLESVKIPTARP